MTNHTQTKPELTPARIAGYKAMVAPLMSMLEQVDYNDPAGARDFQENVNRLIPVKPSFLQLASWFLAKHGPISVGTSRKDGRTVMLDQTQIINWRRFVLDNHRTLKLMATDRYGFDADQADDRRAHTEEIVTGSQYLFAYRAGDAETTVVFGVKVSYMKREFLPDGTEKVTYGTGRT